jgi:hypothetical protein
MQLIPKEVRSIAAVTDLKSVWGVLGRRIESVRALFSRQLRLLPRMELLWTSSVEIDAANMVILARQARYLPVGIPGSTPSGARRSTESC